MNCHDFLRRLNPLPAAFLLSFVCLAGRQASGQANPSNPGSSGASPSAAEAFAKLKGDCFDCCVHFRPEQGAELGLDWCRSKLTDWSEKAIQEHIVQLEQIEARLLALAPSLGRLTPNDGIDHAAMLSLVRARLHFLRDRKGYRGNLQLVLYPYGAIQAQIAQSAPGPDAEKDWKAVLARTEQIPAYLEQVKGDLREGLKNGRIPDRRAVEEDAIPSVEDAAGFFGKDLAEQAAQALGTSSAPVVAGLGQAGAKAKAAYEGLEAFLKTEVLPVSRENFAIGEQEYAWKLKNDFGIQDSTAEVYSKGLKLAKEIRSRMEALAKQIEPGKDLPAVMADLEKDHPADDTALFKAYEETTQRAKDFVVSKGLFSLPPRYKLKVLPMPPGMAAQNSLAAYSPAPPLDPTKEGSFLVPPSGGDQQKLAMHSFARIPSIVVHEAFPGHDLQFHYFQDNAATISPLRHIIVGDDIQSYYSGSLNVEGYALYAENLMREHGFFAPKEELLALDQQLLRAYRVVLDIGLHTGKISFDEAVKTLHEQVFLPLPAAKAQTYQYTSIPTQAVTYLLGRRQIEDLKEKYKQIMGADYKESDFHKAFLSYGPVPPAWIEPALLERARQEKAKLKKSS